MVAKLDVPPTVKAVPTACVIAPPAVKFKMPVMLVVPISKALTSTRVALVPLTMLTAPVKLFVAVFSTMLFAAPGVSVVVPLTRSAPSSVILPLEVTTKSPEMAESPLALPKIMAFVSFKVTSWPLTTRTPPVKLLAASSTMLLPEPAVKSVVPPTVTAPESLIPPAFAVAERFPPIPVALKSISEVLTMVA